MAGPKKPDLKIGVDAKGDGFLITLNGQPAKTPGGRGIALPNRDLADAIAGELIDDPARLTGKGLNDPGVAPNFRLATGAIDVVEGKEAGRSGIVTDLIGYCETDLVLFRAENTPDLKAREDALWNPIGDWFKSRHGVALRVTTGVLAVPQDSAVHTAVSNTIEALTPMRLVALSAATHTAGSIMIGLALLDGAIDADQAYSAACLEERYQADKWGEDAEATVMREGKRLDLVQTAAFLELLSKDEHP